jgi:hypothetical protein
MHTVTVSHQRCDSVAALRSRRRKHVVQSARHGRDGALDGVAIFSFCSSSGASGGWPSIASSRLDLGRARLATSPLPTGPVETCMTIRLAFDEREVLVLDPAALSQSEAERIGQHRLRYPRRTKHPDLVHLPIALGPGYERRRSYGDGRSEKSPRRDHSTEISPTLP